LAVEAGEVAPIDGIFKSHVTGTQVIVQRGAVAQGFGTFCVSRVSLALLQRSHRMSSVSELDRTLSSKGEGGNEETGEGGNEDTDEAVRGKFGGGDTTDEKGNYPALDACTDSIGVGEAFCGGVNQYGCSEAGIINNCGSTENACCSDEDGSCTDGDDFVKCKTEVTQPPPEPPSYGALALCSDTGVWASDTVVCSGHNEYGCDIDSLVAICGAVDRACCSDDDGSCADGDDEVKCRPALPPTYGSLDSCSDTGSVGDTICWGENKYECTTAHMEAECGSVSNACCSDDDGSCVDGDDNVKCISSGNTEPPDAPPYTAVTNMCPEERGSRACAGLGSYGCTETVILNMCDSYENTCCGDQDGSCVDGDDDLYCISDADTSTEEPVGLPPYGSLPTCVVTAEDLGFVTATNQYSSRSMEFINDICGGKNNACCADEDGSCADGDDTVKCITR